MWKFPRQERERVKIVSEREVEMSRGRGVEIKSEQKERKNPVGYNNINRIDRSDWIRPLLLFDAVSIVKKLSFILLADTATDVRLLLLFYYIIWFPSDEKQILVEQERRQKTTVKMYTHTLVEEWNACDIGVSYGKNDYKCNLDEAAGMTTTTITKKYPSKSMRK